MTWYVSFAHRLPWSSPRSCRIREVPVSQDLRRRPHVHRGRILFLQLRHPRHPQVQSSAPRRRPHQRPPVVIAMSMNPVIQASPLPRGGRSLATTTAPRLQPGSFQQPASSSGSPDHVAVFENKRKVPISWITQPASSVHTAT